MLLSITYGIKFNGVYIMSSHDEVTVSLLDEDALSCLLYVYEPCKFDHSLTGHVSKMVVCGKNMYGLQCHRSSVRLFTAGK